MGVSVTRFVTEFTLLLVLNPFLSGACNGPRNVNELTESLYGPGSGYSKLTRPNMAALFGTGQAVNTAAPDAYYFQIQLNQLLHIDTKLQQFTVDVWTREVWYDWRLRHNDSQAYDCFTNRTSEIWTVIPSLEVDKLWNPHFGSKALVEPPQLLDFEAWISSYGRVWLTKRQTFKLSCSMDFTFMPYDTQLCHVPVKVISYYPNEVVLVPGIEDGIAMRITPPKGVFVGGPVDWKIVAGKSLGRVVCEDIGSVTGCSVFLKLTFALRRQPEFYTKHIVAPIFLCMLLAYASFFINRSAAPARVAITAITFLTVSSQIGAVLASLPNLPGNVWLLELLGVSRYFALFANIEYVLASYLVHTEARIQKHKTAAIKAIEERAQNIEVEAGDPRAQQGAAGPAPQSYTGQLDMVHIKTIRAKLSWLDRLLLSRHGTVLLEGKYVDVFSRFAFVIAYGIFLIHTHAALPADDSADD